MSNAAYLDLVPCCTKPSAQLSCAIAAARPQGAVAFIPLGPVALPGSHSCIIQQGVSRRVVSTVDCHPFDGLCYSTVQPSQGVNSRETAVVKMT